MFFKKRKEVVPQGKIALENLVNEKKTEIRDFICQNISQVILSSEIFNIYTIIDFDYVRFEKELLSVLIPRKEKLLIMYYEDTINEFIKFLKHMKIANELYYSELMIMNNNIKSVSSNINERNKKLFEMYNEYYSLNFSEKINDINEFSIIISYCNNIDFFKKLKSEICFSNKNLEYLKKEYSYENILNFLNDQELRNNAKYLNYTKNVNKTLYVSLAKILSENYSLTHILGLIFNFNATVIELDTLQKKYEIELERQRLLRGDLQYEKNLELLRLNFNNIKTGNQFEDYLKFIFETLGYKVFKTKGSGDKGADLILERDDIKYIIQAKFYSKPVGNLAIQQAYSAKDIYKANKAAVITNNDFTKQAIEDASSLNIILINGDKLYLLINELARGKFYNIFSQ